MQIGRIKIRSRHKMGKVSIQIRINIFSKTGALLLGRKKSGTVPGCPLPLAIEHANVRNRCMFNSVVE